MIELYAKNIYGACTFDCFAAVKHVMSAFDDDPMTGGGGGAGRGVLEGFTYSSRGQVVDPIAAADALAMRRQQQSARRQENEAPASGYNPVVHSQNPITEADARALRAKGLPGISAMAPESIGYAAPPGWNARGAGTRGAGTRGAGTRGAGASAAAAMNSLI